MMIGHEHHFKAGFRLGWISGRQGLPCATECDNNGLWRDGYCAGHELGIRNTGTLDENLLEALKTHFPKCFSENEDESKVG